VVLVIYYVAGYPTWERAFAVAFKSARMFGCRYKIHRHWNHAMNAHEWVVRRAPDHLPPWISYRAPKLGVNEVIWNRKVYRASWGR
jgi:hypothetical protein